MPEDDYGEYDAPGSAEPLTPEARCQRLRELADWGVDLTLSQDTLELTPTERVNRMVGLLEIITEMRRSYLAQMQQKKLRSTAETQKQQA